MVVRNSINLYEDTFSATLGKLPLDGQMHTTANLQEGIYNCNPGRLIYSLGAGKIYQ